tara:strand:- start:57231 stop:57899 length:669 start_codon:yes stop_codon:yes gene_type:complete
MIYIVGDSHVSIFSGVDKAEGRVHIQPEFGYCYTLSNGSLRHHNEFKQEIPYFCAIKTGSNTAYNSFDKLPRIEQALKEYGVGDDDYIFTCFGEIDIRNHIGFHLNGKTPEEVIRNTVNRYMKTILHLKDSYRVGVYGSPPSSVGNSGNYGDVVIRNKMTILFNDYLRTKCDEHSIVFKDISKLMIHPDGTTDVKYLVDELHLSKEAIPLIINEFKDIINYE